MSSSPSRRRGRALLSCGFVLLALATSTVLRAQPTPPATPAESVREKTYYVPYTKLDDVFEKVGRGIFLPYEQFLELWNDAAKHRELAQAGKPPVDATVRGGLYKGEVVGDLARFEVEFELEALRIGWSTVKLPLSGVAIERAELSSPDAMLTLVGGEYAILLPRPGMYRAKIAFSVRVAKAPGKKSFGFGIPPLAVSRLELRIPEDGVRVDVQPLIAATESVAESGVTRVLAFLGNSPQVSVSWSPPPGRVDRDGTIVSAAQQIAVRLSERLLRIDTRIDFEVLRGESDEFRVRLPADTRLLHVQADNSRAWTQEGDQLIVQLFTPVKRYQLGLSFERPFEQVPERVDVPFPRIENVLRESGFAVAVADVGLKTRVESSAGLSQLDPQEMPQDLRLDRGLRFGYLAHTAAAPLKLVLAVEKITPVVHAETTSVVALGEHEDVWVGWIEFDVRKAGVFVLQFQVPQVWTVQQVGEPQQIEDFQASDAEGQRTVTVNLRARALGNLRVPFRLTRAGGVREGALTFPALRVVGAAQDRGLLGVSVPRAVEAVTTTRTALVDIDVDPLLRTGILGQVGGDAGIPRAFRYRSTPASVELRLTARKTEIDVIAQHLVEVGDGEIKHTHLLDYNVMYAPVDKLYFTAPAALDNELKIETKQKTDVRKSGKEGDATIWEVSLQPPVLGGVTVSIVHSQELKALAAGVPISQSVALLHATRVRNEQGFVAIRKDGTLEIAPEAVELETIDSGDLPDKLRRGQIYSAFRYFGAKPTLTLKLTRHDYARLATTAVPLVHLRSIWSEELNLRTSAVIFVQNAARQYLAVRLPTDAKILSLSVGGQKQVPMKKNDATMIPIPRSQGAGGTFPVVLVYETRIGAGEMGRWGGDGFRTLEILPEEQLGDVPIGKIELELYLPPNYVYFGFGGNLHRRAGENVWLWERFKTLVSQATGVTAPAASAMGDGGTRPAVESTGVDIELQTRGYVVHRFETLADRGALSLRFIERRWFWVFDALCGIAAFLALLTAFRVRPRWRGELASAALALALLCTWLWSDAKSQLAASAFAGFGLAALVLVLRQVRAGLKARRTRKLELASDPYLEDAQHESSAEPPIVAPPIVAPRSDSPSEKAGE
ncbi:MAG: hypothetical protein ACKVX7_03525 [Planctomycetota bacterium]